MRGIVRYVTLRQLGHFMMGKVILAGHVISLSGAYGNDGLVCDVAPEVFALGKDLPTELQEAWNTGGGHNSVGSEAPAMKAWAIENSATQRRRRR
jgi:hypothetical protein